MIRALLFITIAFTLSACAAKYAPSNDGVWSDKPGYIAIQVDSSTYRVAFSGQNMTLENTDRYAFYRAAELTLEKGFDYFVVLQNGLDERGLDAETTGDLYAAALAAREGVAAGLADVSQIQLIQQFLCPGATHFQGE